MSASITLICDNDKVGKDAAVQISKILKRSIRILTFTEEFPVGFDLADAFPHEMSKAINGVNAYVGPSFRSLVSDGTWATKKIITDKRGRPEYELRSAFAEQWLYSVSPLAFVHRRNPGKLYSVEAFNACVRPFSDLKDTASKMQTSFAQQAAGICYEPGRETGLIEHEGEKKINTFVFVCLKSLRPKPSCCFRPPYSWRHR